MTGDQKGTGARRKRTRRKNLLNLPTFMMTTVMRGQAPELQDWCCGSALDLMMLPAYPVSHDTGCARLGSARLGPDGSALSGVSRVEAISIKARPATAASEALHSACVARRASRVVRLGVRRMRASVARCSVLVPTPTAGPSNSACVTRRVSA